MIKSPRLSKRNHHYLQYPIAICNLSSPVSITIAISTNNSNCNNITTTVMISIRTNNINIIKNKFRIYLNLKTLSQTHSPKISTLLIYFHHHHYNHKLIDNKTTSLNNKNKQKRKINANYHQNYSCSNFVDQSTSKKHNK